MKPILSFSRFALVAALVLIGSTGGAATFPVTNPHDSGAGSLRQAIVDANNMAGDDTVVFDLPANSPRVVQITSTSTSVSSTVTVLNDRPGDGPVTIQVIPPPSFSYPCFDVAPTGRLVLSGLILAGPPGNQKQDSGIRNRGGYLALRNCTLSGNNGRQGGGLYNTGQAILTNCVITGNRAALQGGGVYNDGGQLSIQYCVISDNSAVWSGGGIYNVGSGYLMLIDSTVNGNTTTDTIANTIGGAGLVNGGLAGISNCTFSNNRVVTWGGGAIYTIGGLTANNCTFVNNKGESGGAIWDHGSSKRQSFLNNCTFSGNTATSGGAAIYANHQYVNRGMPKLSVNNCTFSENVQNGFAGQATSIGNAILSGGSGTKVEVGNSLFRRLGSSGNLYSFGGASITSRGHNLTDDAAGGDSGTGPGGMLNAPGDIRNTDPQLGPLADNGGPTMTHALLLGSPAIDAADNAISTLRDQRGRVRSGGRDIGSFELNGTVSTALN